MKRGAALVKHVVVWTHGVCDEEEGAEEGPTEAEEEEAALEGNCLVLPVVHDAS